jgi:carotenoid 1,2-hydratase
MRPEFARTVAPGGYLWWYIDAFSDDGRHGLTLIAFVGSVFSPYYTWARGRSARPAQPAGGLGASRIDPLDHCALNVALYGPRDKRWTMTERARRYVRRSAHTLAIGPSALEWDHDTLTIDIDEVTVPWPSRLRGRICLRPTLTSASEFSLDAGGAHRWRPLAPAARIDVTLSHPDLQWSGNGYLDANAGDAPLQDAFVRWDWSRSHLAGDEVAVLYDVSRRDGSRRALALRFGRDGEPHPFTPPPATALPGTFWRVARSTFADGPAHVVRTLEDAPFYARSLIECRLLGRSTLAMHESLSLDRFASRWVQLMLPFRMPRRTGG